MLRVSRWYALLVVIMRCAPHEEPDKPVVPGAGCEEACDRLSVLGCPEGEPTPAGAPCVEVCENGMAGRYDLACVAGIESCQRLQSCEK